MSSIALLAPDREGGTAEGGDGSKLGGDNFATCLLLGVAYSASIGGLGTLIGTPPNAFMAGFLQENL